MSLIIGLYSFVPVGFHSLPTVTKETACPRGRLRDKTAAVS